MPTKKKKSRGSGAFKGINPKKKSDVIISPSKKKNSDIRNFTVTVTPPKKKRATLSDAKKATSLRDPASLEKVRKQLDRGREIFEKRRPKKKRPLVKRKKPSKHPTKLA